MESICIIGAGPAGLMAAIAAGRTGVSVVMLERQPVAGSKLLLTGGGRCNLTHQGTSADFVKASMPYGNSLKPAFYAFTPQDLLDFFRDHGIETITEPNGCVFPKTKRAVHVRDCLLDQAKRHGMQWSPNSRVVQIEKTQDRFALRTEAQTILASAVIIATGGASWPQTGSTGDGYELARRFGHSVIGPMGILCPVVCKETWPASLQGTSLEQLAVTVKSGSRKVVCTGAAVFTRNGIGGFAAFDVTRVTADAVRQGTPTPVTLDFCPTHSREQVEAEWIETFTAHPKKEMLSILAAYVPKRLAEVLLRTAEVNQNILASQLRRDQRKRLAALLKEMPLTVTGHGPLEKATVTRGGIAGREVDFKTMQSRLCPGLFFAGEVLDVDGPCGGCNLQIAFSTGALAGASAAASLKNVSA
jgi:predicted Rossmann fold flavoprotein